ncbi:TonB-dependent receptor [Gimibacter soli]|uniref:TonB-dependent receptor n=1 Tax=Gimibacter soli TaxID=3024400 RepID=A0AAE9XNJ8_9PROT|nr:TonB-dependent receptor [Gimibacter soli]WCL53302.1 TonB-dependent receptor [Gimibacter soli]
MPNTNRIAMRVLTASASLIAMAGAVVADDDFALEEIVVTAQKVSENIQEVPISMSAVTPQRMENAGVTSLETIGRIVPSVSFRKGTTSANSAIVMRGVGTITFSVAAEPSVSTVVDGVVLSRSGQAFLDLVDAERLEVLRGPQGTLFGKNASAGLVNIVSKGGTEELEAEARAEWYEGNEYRLRTSVSGPLSEQWSGRVTGFYGSYDGNIKNIYGGEEEDVNGYEHWGARGVLDYKGDSSRMRFIADYFKANDDCCADVAGASVGAVRDAELGLPGGVDLGEDQRYINHNLVTQTNDKQWSLTASADFDISDSHTLSMVAGYRNWWNEEIREGDFQPRAIVGVAELHDNGVVETEQLSFEARIASDQSKPFFYQVGAFAWRSDNKQVFTREDITCATSNLPVDPVTGGQPCNLTDTVNTLFPTATSYSDVNSTNYAVFGQGTYRFNEMFALTGGLRYTWDRLSYTHERAPGINAATGLPATGPGVSGNPAGGLVSAGGNGTNISEGSSRNGNLSGKAVLQFTPSDDMMLYTSYTRGYKGPAFNVFFNHTAPTHAVPIEEETSDAFEVGMKSQFMNDRVQLNASVFSVEYDGFQANNFVLLNGAVVTNLTNAGTVKSKGFETDLVFLATEGLTLRLSTAYADAKVKEFNPNPLTNAPDARDGTRLPLAPKFTYVLGADYEREVGDYMMYLNTDYRHVGKQFSDLGEQGAIDAYGMWNASLGFSDKDDSYRLSFHVRNITDESYVLLNVSNGQRLQIPRDADRYMGVSFRIKM